MRRTTRQMSIHRKQAYILNDKEFERPGLVFDELFEAFDLCDIRERLRDMTDSALFDHDCDAQSYFFLFRYLEKLVEAAHLMATRNNTGNCPQESVSGETEQDLFTAPYAENIAEVRPDEMLQKSFAAYDMHSLIGEIERWKRRIMTGMLGDYGSPDRREQCWTFCDQLMCLVESAYLYQRDGRPEEMREIKNFFSLFTLDQAQSELRNLFDSLLADHRKTLFEPSRTLSDTRNWLATILIAAYYLIKWSAPAGTTATSEKQTV